MSKNHEIATNAAPIQNLPLAQNTSPPVEVPNAATMKSHAPNEPPRRTIEYLPSVTTN